jgi:curved DNA-binding protein
MNYYEILGVLKTSTPDEIKRAYRKLASQHHPDKGGNTAEFQKIQSAYETLSDPIKRLQYDNPAPQFLGRGGDQFGMHDLFKQAFGFGQQPQRRNHVRMNLNISLLDVARGGSRTVNVSTSSGSSTVQIGIPPGINDGDSVQYGGIAPGGLDLVVTYRIMPDSKWRRDGLNLHTDIRMNIWDMILGTELEVTTLTEEKLSVKVPLSSQPNTTMRLRGRGLIDQNGQAGDLLVKLLADIPAAIAPEIITAIQQYRN